MNYGIEFGHTRTHSSWIVSKPNPGETGALHSYLAASIRALMKMGKSASVHTLVIERLNLLGDPLIQNMCVP
jgi:hypothetical protein